MRRSVKLGSGRPWWPGGGCSRGRGAWDRGARRLVAIHRSLHHLHMRGEKVKRRATYGPDVRQDNQAAKMEAATSTVL